MEDCKLVKYSETVRVSFEYLCPEKKVKHSIKLINPKIETRNYNSDIDEWSERLITFDCKICKKEHTFRLAY